MKKVMTVQIPKEWQGVSVGKFLKMELHLTSAQIRSLKFQKEGIMRNQERCRVTQILQQGDLLQIHMQENRPGSGKSKASGKLPTILYEDEDVICVWKPAGRVTHPVAGHETDTATGDLVTYFEGKKEEVLVHSIGRLDKDTAGILIFAKNKMAASRLWEQKEHGILVKEYLAWCQGVFPKEAKEKWQTICVPVEKAASDGGSGQKMQTAMTGKRAVTHYRVCRQTETEALVHLWLETGRTHQIRVHMAFLGHPLVGDSLYGTGIPHRDRARLCAWKVRFLQPFTGKEIVLEHGDPLYQTQEVPVVACWR